MTPRELLGTAEVPGGEPLRLFRRGGDFMIVMDRNELMNSRMSGSEESLATLAIERLGGRKAPHLLIGGYGMGNSYMGMGSNYGSSNYLTQMQYQQMLYRMQMMNSSYGTYGNYGYNNNSYLTGTSSNPYVPIPAPSTSYNYTSSGIIPATTSSSAYVPIPAITTTNSYYNGR